MDKHFFRTKKNKEKRKRVMRNADRNETNRKGKTICNNYRIIGFGRNSKNGLIFLFSLSDVGEKRRKKQQIQNFFKEM